MERKEVRFPIRVTFHVALIKRQLRKKNRKAELRLCNARRPGVPCFQEPLGKSRHSFETRRCVLQRQSEKN